MDNNPTPVDALKKIEALAQARESRLLSGSPGGGKPHVPMYAQLIRDEISRLRFERDEALERVENEKTRLVLQGGIVKYLKGERARIRLERNDARAGAQAPFDRLTKEDPKP